jgi:heat shock protein HslJ
MKNLFFLIGVTLFLSCSGGNKLTDQHIYWVNSTKSPCVGMAPTKCLQVQKSETLAPSAWESFYASIIGFDYEPGYIYKILVKERKLDPADLSADASSIEYTLVEILEKRQDMKFRINDIWVAIKIKGEPILADKEGISTPQLEIHVGEMRYMGTDGCNNYHGGIIELDEHTVRFGVTAMTRMMCEEMKIPDLFNTSIPEIMAWEIKENQLHLFDAEGKEVMLLNKSD